MGQLERLLSAITVLLIFIYVVLRAVYVPTFHDEAATFFHYVVTGNFLPFQAHWDANNHILNSALAYFSYKVLGPEQIWIRLPNVLSFLVYGFFAIRITAELKSDLLRWLTLIAVLTSAFLLEFFSLARGYAMSIAFLLGAVYYASQYFSTKKLKHQLSLWFWMVLAVTASLTLVNSYLILLGLSFLTLFRVESNRWQHVVVWLVFGLICFSAVSYYGFQLKGRGLLYTGLADGFVGVTVQSLVRYQLQIESHLVAVLITIIGGLSSLFLLFRLVLKRVGWSAIRLTAFLLLFNAVGSVLLNWIFGINFPENRVGMYYIPLFLITFAGALDEMSTTSKNVKFVGLSLLFFPVHLSSHLNLNTTILWPKWHASDVIYNEVLEHQRSVGKTLTISAEYLNELGWAYYNFQNNAELQLLQRDPVPDTLSDLLIARSADFDFTTVPYDTMYFDHANGIYLLNRKHPIDWSAAKRMELKQKHIKGSDEFYEILNGSKNELPATAGTFELHATVNAKEGMWDGQLVIASYNTDGNDTYNMIPVHWIRPEWKGDDLLVKRTYHFSDDATTYKVYFWNMNKQEIELDIEFVEFRSPQ